MDKQEYKELVSDLIEGQNILKRQLKKSNERVLQLECLVADVKADYMDMGGDESHFEYMERQCNRIKINEWGNND